MYSRDSEYRCYGDLQHPHLLLLPLILLVRGGVLFSCFCQFLHIVCTNMNQLERSYVNENLTCKLFKVIYRIGIVVHLSFVFFVLT